jgi:hypothetical protein
MLEGSGSGSGFIPLTTGSGGPRTYIAALQVVWQHGFGYADLENKLLAGTGCVMRIASIRYPTHPVPLKGIVQRDGWYDAPYCAIGN